MPLVHATRRKKLGLPELSQTATLRAFMAARHMMMMMTLDALMDRCEAQPPQPAPPVARLLVAARAPR